MPILPPTVFGTWYVVTLDAKPRILSSFSEVYNAPVSNEGKVIQGDIGSHIVDVQPSYYSTSISSPILIIEPNDVFYDAFDIVLENLQKIQIPITTANRTNFNYVLQSASISLSPEASNITASLESWKTFDDAQNFKTYKPNYDFIARQAKFYDIQFGMFGQNYLIQQADLQIAVSNEKIYYVSGSNNFYGSQTPLYAILGYRVSGSVTLVIKPDQYDALKLYNAQSPGVFSASQHSLYLKVLHRTTTNTYDKTLNLGDFMFMPTVELSISPQQVITARVNFVTLFRRTSAITV